MEAEWLLRRFINHEKKKGYDRYSLLVDIKFPENLYGL